MSSVLKKPDKSNMLYSCPQCNYHCRRRNDLNKHFGTQKHARVVNQHSASPDDTHPVPKSKPKPKPKSDITACMVSPKNYNCLCGKVYRHSTSLYKHRRLCEYFQKHLSSLSTESEPESDPESEAESVPEPEPEPEAEPEPEPEPDVSLNVDSDAEISRMLIALMSEQSKGYNTVIEQIEQQGKQIAEVAAKVDTMGVTNNFNLNVFLNSDCKDAMNVMDFVQTIKVTSADLERLADVGYVEGVARIMLDGLRKLDVCQRPIHCTDVKRESFYIKDKDVWEKDNANGDKMHHVVKNVAHRNVAALPEWQKENPSHRDFSTRKHEQYMRIVNAAYGGSTQDETNNFRNKIIRKAAPELVPPKKSAREKVQSE